MTIKESLTAQPWPTSASRITDGQRKLFALIGLYFVHWSSFELAMDLGIAKLCKLSHPDAVRKTTGWQISEKVNLLIEKLEQSSFPNKDEILRVLETLPSDSIRNVIAHSYMRFGDNNVIFVHRNRKGHIRRVELTYMELLQHLAAVSSLASALELHLNNTENELESYFSAAETT